jgi:hypothetical protein
MSEHCRERLQLLKEAEEQKRAIDKDLRREFVQRWNAAFDLIESVLKDTAVAVFGDRGLNLVAVPGKRDISITWERQYAKDELRYHPDFGECKVTWILSTPAGRESSPVSLKDVTVASVEAQVEEFIEKAVAYHPVSRRVSRVAVLQKV